MEASSNEVIVEKCLKMEVGTSEKFTLDHKPVQGEISRLAVTLSQKRGGRITYSILRNGRDIDVSCYIPDIPKN